MLDLKNLGVVELNVQEVVEIDGGIAPLVLLCIWYCIHPAFIHKAY